MNFLKNIGKAITKTNHIVGTFAALLLFPMMFIVFAEVFMREIFEFHLNLIFDITWICYVFLAFLGAGYTLAQNGHVKADIIYNKFKKRGKIVLNILCYPLFCFLPMIVMMYSTYHIFYMELFENQGRGFWTPLEYPMWVLRFVVFIGMVLLSLQWGVKFFGFIRKVKDGDEL